MTSTAYRTRPTTDSRTASMGMKLARGAAGGVFAVVTMWFVTTLGMPATMPLQMIAATVQGQDALMAGTANQVLGFVVHMVLSIAYGVAFAAIATRLPSNAAIAVAGAGYGLLLYLVNFLVIAPMVFPWFADANQPFELVIHVVFGVVVSFAVFRWVAGDTARR